MDRSNEAAGPSLQAMKQFATQMRKSAEASIVEAYRLSLEGRGEGPSQTDLKVFARLAAYEIRLERRMAAGALSASHEQAYPAPDLQLQPPRLPAPMLVQRSAEATSAHAPTAKARRTLPMAALVSTVLLVTCVAATSWMVGRAATGAANPTTSVANQSPSMQSPAMPRLPVGPANADRPYAADAQALAPPVSENRSLRNRPSEPASVVGALRARGFRPAAAVAACGGLNFLSHAICMNNACAQPAMTRTRICADAVHQRRIDEARRNPYLMG